MSSTDCTNGHGYLITGMATVGDRQAQVHFLLPDGRRRSVVVDVWNLADETVAKAAAAFDEHRRSYRPDDRQAPHAANSG